MKTSRDRNYNIAIISVLSAIMFVMVNTPLGTIPAGSVSFTISHIPIFIATLMFGLKEGLIMGFIFGLMTMAKAFYAPAGVLDVIFQNPLISILPRLLIPITTYYTKQVLGKLKPVLKDTIAVLVGSFTNTIFVFVAIYLFANIAFEEAMGGMKVFALLISLLTSAAIVEAIAACLITVPIVSRINLKRK